MSISQYTVHFHHDDDDEHYDDCHQYHDDDESDVDAYLGSVAVLSRYTRRSGPTIETSTRFLSASSSSSSSPYNLEEEKILLLFF